MSLLIYFRRYCFFGASLPSLVLGTTCGFMVSSEIIKRPARDTCLCMGELPTPHFVFLITL